MVVLAACLTASIAWGDDDPPETQPENGMVEWLHQPVSPPSSQYASYVPSENTLLISWATIPTQYVANPVGTPVQLVANVPKGGDGRLYTVVESSNLSIESESYKFDPGSNVMDFDVKKAGRHMIYFRVDNLTSNVIIMDVFNQMIP